MDGAVDLSDKHIINVWKHNFDEEMNRIMDVVEEYKFISLDTEFPGVVHLLVKFNILYL